MRLMTSARALRTVPLVVLSVAFAACGSETTGPDAAGTAPPLPPLSSMSLDLSYFGGSGGPGSVGSGDAASLAGPNFTQAALRVFVAEVVAVAVLAVPTATFGAALQAGSKFENGTWHWQTSASSIGGTWSAHLTGSIQGPDALWEMRVTSPPSFNPPLDDFLWYSGVSKLDGSSGVWRINNGDEGGTNEVVRLDWNHVSTEDHSLTINVTRAGAPELGDYVSYSVDGPLRTILYYDASEATTVEIAWDATTLEGYIIAPGFNGGVKACWDRSQNDVTCAT